MLGIQVSLVLMTVLKLILLSSATSTTAGVVECVLERQNQRRRVGWASRSGSTRVTIKRLLLSNGSTKLSLRFPASIQLIIMSSLTQEKM